MDSLQGHLLIASPHLADTNFYRSVVLMVQHDEQGAFGVLLNRPTSNSVSDVLRLVDADAVENREPVFLGGPVGGPLTALHADAARGEIQVVPRVFFASDKDIILQIANQPEKPFRLFVGYSGWGAGQLDSEMKAGGWLTLPATHDVVFSDYADLWNRVSRRVGLEILGPTIQPKRFPEDPSVN
jgi:putative transcriptional regulator